MREDEIREGIQSICNLSKENSKYLNDKNALIGRLNSLQKGDLALLEYEFKTPGPVVNLRKEVLRYLLEGKKLDEQTFENFINKHLAGNEQKFELFSEFLMFQQFIAPQEHKQIRKFIEQFSDEIIKKLRLEGKVKNNYIDYQGRSHQGVEKFSLLVYNLRSESESKRVQLWIEFQDCMIKYGVKRQNETKYITGPEVRKSTDFDFEALISFFEENKALLLKDEPKDEPKESETNFVLENTRSQSEDRAMKEFPCNIILYGPPGTGKTYNTIDLAVKIITGTNASHEENKKIFDILRKEGQIEFITFHQNYSYEDFLIGIRPDLDEASTLKFRRREGIFYSMCKRAEQNYLQSQNQTEVSLNRYVLIIDEINRANISKVFGELITLLEEDKRIGAKNELRVSIPGEKAYFGIPPNVYVIGTMNTADKSIAMIDIALRRRFEFIGYFPDYNKVDELSGDILKHVNTEIYNRKKSADYLIGHGYFMNGDEPPETSKVLENKVIPLLMEYFSGKTEVVEEIFKGSEWSVKYDTEKYGWEIKQQLKQ